MLEQPPVPLHQPKSDSPLTIVPLPLDQRVDRATAQLVLTAVGIRSYYYRHQQQLFVRQGDLRRAEKQLSAFLEENENWPFREKSAPPPGNRDQDATLPLILLLGSFHFLTGPWQEASLWFTQGALDSHLVLKEGQWWRLVTALTLHADLNHLLGNCLLGGLVIHLLCRNIGSGLAWLLLLAAGSMGNLGNIILRAGEHHSVGFSTAVFASIGISCGLQVRRGNRLVRSLLLSLGAGSALLALLGTEGEHTDLGAHFFGFGAGILFGVLVAVLQLPLRAKRLQPLLLGLTLLWVTFAWYLALQDGFT